MKIKMSIALAACLSAVVFLSGCGDEDNKETAEVVSYINKVSAAGAELPYSVLRADIDDGANAGQKMEVRKGGYGSASTMHPTNINQFYALTDRGSNAGFTGTEGKGKKFLTPDYTPRIGLFEIAADGTVKLVKDILLKDRDGNEITGLPNNAALGGTGETPYDVNGSVIKNSDGTIKLDDYGIDSEGIAALNDGTFWISDEYGPHMVHYDATGKEIGRINPFSADTRNIHVLPAEFANRRANRGMEGLAITPDQKTLVGIMQSTMYNPSKAVKSLDITRIVTINIETGATAQYLYKQEAPSRSNSEIATLSATEFLVIERDANLLNGGSEPANLDTQKHIYRIDLSTGTNLENIASSGVLDQNETLGLTIAGLTLEEAVLDGGWDALLAHGIKPVEKTLVVDMAAKIGYPHDKMEGLLVINSTTLGVLNDDDFATYATDAGVLEQKYIDAAKSVIDHNRLYIVSDLNLSTK